tara:strand:+ start:1674 stop:1928 length:255 start_codon:yes stop_codon:yes gene_type:complete
MNNAAQIKSDTLNIILCNRIHERLNIKARALKIARACKIVRDSTKDELLYDACRQIIKAVSAGSYLKAIDAINQTEINYIREYR